MRAVQHEEAPRDAQLGRGRVLVGGHEQGLERLGPTLDAALGPCALLVDVDPVRRDAHEHVRPDA